MGRWSEVIEDERRLFSSTRIVMLAASAVSSGVGATKPVHITSPLLVVVTTPLNSWPSSFS